MDRSIQFDADEVIEELSYLQRVQMPFVMSYGLNKLGPRLRELHARDMARDFDRPVPFTLNSPRYSRSSKEKLEIEFWVSEDGAKGQDPARYLFPQVREAGRNSKQVYVTRFNKAARRYGLIDYNDYLMPVKNSKAARLNQYGNISPGQYTQVLYSIGAFTDFINRQAGQRKREPKKEYYVVKPGNKRGAFPGIYRRKGDTTNLLFATLPEVPTVAPKYDFYGNTEDWATDYFPQYVEQKLSEIMP